MSERRRDGKVKGEKWKVKGGLTRWGIDRISPLPERFLTGVIFNFGESSDSRYKPVRVQSPTSRYRC